METYLVWEDGDLSCGPNIGHAGVRSESAMQNICVKCELYVLCKVSAQNEIRDYHGLKVITVLIHLPNQFFLWGGSRGSTPTKTRNIY